MGNDSQLFGSIQEAGLPIKSCEIIMDRTVAGAARNRHEQLKGEEKATEDQIKVNAEAVESLVRILSKNLDQQLFNKANEIQEEISKKRYDLRCYQIRLSGIQAQKHLYDNSEKQQGDNLIAVPSGVASEKVTGKFKSKWVNAFKNVKGGGGKGPVGPAGVKPPTAVGPPPVLETSHQFAEYSYKNITSCDVCSQIMKGNTRQGLKCQPKAKFSRMKSGSEMGDEDRLSLAGSIAPDQKRQSFINSKNPSTKSQQLLTPPNELQSGEVSPIRRKMGGSYSRYTGAAPLH